MGVVHGCVAVISGDFDFVDGDEALRDVVQAGADEFGKTRAVCSLTRSWQACPFKVFSSVFLDVAGWPFSDGLRFRLPKGLPPWSNGARFIVLEPRKGISIFHCALS